MCLLASSFTIPATSDLLPLPFCSLCPFLHPPLGISSLCSQAIHIQVNASTFQHPSRRDQTSHRWNIREWLHPAPVVLTLLSFCPLQTNLCWLFAPSSCSWIPQEVTQGSTAPLSYLRAGMSTTPLAAPTLSTSWWHKLHVQWRPYICLLTEDLSFICSLETCGITFTKHFPIFHFIIPQVLIHPRQRNPTEIEVNQWEKEHQHEARSEVRGSISTALLFHSIKQDEFLITKCRGFMK